MNVLYIKVVDFPSFRLNMFNSMTDGLSLYLYKTRKYKWCVHVFIYNDIATMFDSIKQNIPLYL